MGYRVRGQAVRINIYADAQDIIECEQVAAKKDRSLSEIIREAIRKYLENEKAG